jgi:hypothetical protein
MKEFKFYFGIYLAVLLVFIIFFLAAVHNSSVNNSMAEWVINYQGGFTRRGFIGEIVFQISQFFNFQLRKVFLGLQIILYLGYFFSLFFLFKKIKYNFIFSLAIFSPLLFIFSLAELEALGRKDILMFFVFIVNFLIFIRYKNKNYNYIYFIITFPVVFLTHEIYIIYTVYFLAFFVMIEKKFNLLFIIKFLSILLLIFILLNLITTNEFSKENFDLLCKNLKDKSNETCGLAPYSMMINLDGYRSEVAWKLPHVIRYVLIFLVGFFGLIISIFFSKINKFETNFLISKINLNFIFLIIALPSLLPFLTAVDSGRYSSMAYTFPCIFYFGLLRSNLIVFDYGKVNYFLNNSFFKYKKYRVIVIFLFCFTWTPKAVYHEDLSSFPLYRTIEKIPNFIGNFKNFHINQL